jgi:hypothetical protein
MEFQDVADNNGEVFDAELVEGLATPEKRSDRTVLEANLDYWDKTRLPRLHRIIFDNTLNPKEAVELVQTSTGRVDLVNELRPLYR